MSPEVEAGLCYRSERGPIEKCEKCKPVQSFEPTILTSANVGGGQLGLVAQNCKESGSSSLTHAVNLSKTTRFHRVLKQTLILGRTEYLADEAETWLILLIPDFTVTGDPVLKKALEIDSKIKRERPDNWRGVRAREQVIKGLLYEKLQDKDAVERIFPIIKAQAEY